MCSKRVSRSASIGTRLCPPARTLASSPCSASSAVTSESDSGAWYSNGAGFIGSSGKALRRVNLPQAPPGTHGRGPHPRGDDRVGAVPDPLRQRGGPPAGHPGRDRRAPPRRRRRRRDADAASRLEARVRRRRVGVPRRPHRPRGLPRRRGVRRRRRGAHRGAQRGGARGDGGGRPRRRPRLARVVRALDPGRDRAPGASPPGSSSAPRPRAGSSSTTARSASTCGSVPPTRSLAARVGRDRADPADVGDAAQAGRRVEHRRGVRRRPRRESADLPHPHRAGRRRHRVASGRATPPTTTSTPRSPDRGTGS